MADESDDTPAEPTQSAAELLPAVYTELRRLAAALSARLTPGQTLQPTALVHEAYLKLVRNRDLGWEGRRRGPCATSWSIRRVTRDVRNAAAAAGGSS
jgi:hypothetical protein